MFWKIWHDTVLEQQQSTPTSENVDCDHVLRPFCESTAAYLINPIKFGWLY